MTTRILLSSLLLLIGVNSFAQTPRSDFSFKEPVDLNALKKITLWSTQYYIHQFETSGSIPIVFQDDSPSTLFADTCDFCKASLEGTAFITDSSGQVTIINYASTGDSSLVDCRSCKTYSHSKLDVERWGKVRWARSSGFGDGVQNYRLIPFRTIAVDSKVIAYGTVIFIPDAKGKTIEMPDGEKLLHDGYFFAGDTGSAIKGNHIDIFTGIYAGNPFPEIIRSSETKTFEAFIVTELSIIDVLGKIQTK